MVVLLVLLLVVVVLLVLVVVVIVVVDERHLGTQGNWGYASSAWRTCIVPWYLFYCVVILNNKVLEDLLLIMILYHKDIYKYI